MKQLIVQGLQQAYQNLVHMISVFLPRLVAMLLIMLAGLFVALLLKYLLRLILRFTQLNRLSEQSGASQVLRNAALPTISELLTRSLFWITWLGFTLVGVSVLGIPELHEQLSRLFQLLPEIFVAILILFVGVLAANFLSRATLLAAVNAGVRSPRLWSGSTRFVILILAISMALEQIGLANQTVTSAFSIIFGALMLALAIAFGLGGRDLARQTLERYLGDSKTTGSREGEGRRAVAALTPGFYFVSCQGTPASRSLSYPGGRFDRAQNEKRRICGTPETVAAGAARFSRCAALVRRQSPPNSRCGGCGHYSVRRVRGRRR